MLAPSVNVIDPLVSSPQKVTRHNNDMAAIQEPPNLELTPSTFASLESTSGNIIAKSKPSFAAAGNSVLFQKEQEVGSDGDSDDDDQDPFEHMMNRGNYLRQLRLLALADEQERLAELESSQPTSASSSSDCDCFPEEKKECTDESNMVITKAPPLEDEVTIHPFTKEKILNYNSYLAHQRYYDDLKHVDIRYIDYGTINNPNYRLASDSAMVKRGNDNGGQNCGNLILEQRKTLGKGGFCWDAAFCLGEFVIQKESEWNPNYYDYYNNLDNASASTAKKTNVLELGAGTGLCGLMIAKATNSHVLLTDLPELLDLMESNVVRNYCRPCESPSTKSAEGLQDDITNTAANYAKGTASAHILRWGTPDDYKIAPSNDVIIGADIVASLYDPIALAQTLYDLSGPTTKIYISSKSRLNRPHELFWGEMECLFERVEKVFNVCYDSSGDEKSWSRLRNTGVFFIVAEGKKQKT